MSLSRTFRGLGGAIVANCFSAIVRIPGVVGLVPASRIRRLLSIAALPDLKYGGTVSLATYTPWRADARFIRIFRAVRHNTLVDELRCYELWDLVGQIGILPEGDVLEVGVWRGGTGCLMAARCALDGITSRVYLCDTFRGVVNAGSRDTAYVGGEHSDASQAIVLDLASRLGVSNVHILCGVFPAEVASEIESHSFRLCHVDVDVYESAKATFDWVWPRLVVGGIVVFDDYGFYTCGGITRLVNDMRGLMDRLVLYNVNGHAIVIKLALHETVRRERV